MGSMYRRYDLYSNATDKEWGPQYDNLAYQPELVSRLQRTWPNSQKQTLFSGESNNDWDNMPPDYSPNTRNCKRFLVIFGVLLLIIGVAAGIVVAIYFSSQGKLLFFHNMVSSIDRFVWTLDKMHYCIFGAVSTF
ncbi:uncharacterized protein LOC106875178 isoform X2 [Octopus bimaculoides]|uniref:uncharacterized protein LOC106875178 isoform X2 n=1 Tax=Octopus bimaculoides TaxID=37653 RepID=UPI0022DFBAB5|nr:uncharacterized protein LOC106875178 isoform X2 [Octopus bimaculoides]